MDNTWVLALMWFSGWYYFSKLRDRIEQLESQMNKPQDEINKI